MSSVVPFSLKDAPALIERLLPVQKLSAEAYKEQMAGSGKTLTALGSYWKGRKPLILNKACILGALLPATDNPKRDLEIFEKLMAMDDESFAVRWPRRPKPKEILATLSIANPADYFVSEPPSLLPDSTPVDWAKPEYEGVKIYWRDDVSELDRRRLQAQMLPKTSFRERADEARRADEVSETVHDHIWRAVNDHLGTQAQSFPCLIEQLGVMRFGHRPRVADTFCGSGQIPFEASRLGCEVYASDLNPIACMLTWGAFHIVGGTAEERNALRGEQATLISRVKATVDELGVEHDGNGWHSKVFLYCLEVKCPQTGWTVPLLPNLVVSKSRMVVARLVPDPVGKRYSIEIHSGVSQEELTAASTGTIGRDSRFDEATLVHSVNGQEYRTKLSTLRGDLKTPSGFANALRRWDLEDFMPRADDLVQERLYAVLWMRPKKSGKAFDYEFRSVSNADLRREEIVNEFVKEHLSEWQHNGWVPTMKIEPGGPPRYQGLDLIRSRGWSYWHHLFNPRQLMIAALVRSELTALSALAGF